jgi:uncharacterized membrane protein
LAEAEVSGAEGDLAAGAAASAAAAPGGAGDAMGWLDSTPKIDHDRVLAAIRAAEEKTSGEIRVAIARHKVEDPVAAAQAYFGKMGMDKSPHRNGVLIFLAPRSRKFAVIGDRAVHEKCGDAFWASLAEAIGGHFRSGNFTSGITHGIERAGELLAKTFPRSKGDPAAKAPEAADVD